MPQPWHEIFQNITNNYRFVPLDPEVAKAEVRIGRCDPQVADDVRPQLSHDLPIPGSLSGVIEMSWEASTPVLFGRQSDDTDADGHVYRVTKPQVLHGGKGAPYVIPGRALRGMIRQVLRIATRSRLGPIDDIQPTRRDPTYQLGRLRTPTKFRTSKVAARSQHQLPPGERDWSDAMLGFVDADSALRGRVSFGFAVCETPDPPLWPTDGRFLSVIQMEPRPGFFPFYLRQGKNGGRSYDSEDSLLAGRKRFGVWSDEDIWSKGYTDNAYAALSQRCGPLAKKQPEDKKNNGTMSHLSFVDSGVRFRGRIRFHNLLPVELGALLWALSLGDERAFEEEPLSTVCHVGGRARSFCFGNLVPFAITLRSVREVHTDLRGDDEGGVNAGRLDREIGNPAWRTYVESFGERVHGLAKLEQLNSERHLARLRHLSDFERADTRLRFGLRFADDSQFADYRNLRNQADRSRTSDKRVAQNLTARGAGVAFTGNILDFGSDPAGD
jgi:hypothetical protein